MSLHLIFKKPHTHIFILSLILISTYSQREFSGLKKIVVPFFSSLISSIVIIVCIIKMYEDDVVERLNGIQ